MNFIKIWEVDEDEFFIKYQMYNRSKIVEIVRKIVDKPRSNNLIIIGDI